ncbi:MAG TPA: hypothetical protein VJV39_24955, partial [Dongiaceae bacterium]|nr:hypothetical protein [Dongiaceae bacterium]
MVRSKARVLAGGVSLIALGVMSPSLAYADDTFVQLPGSYTSTTNANNVYTVSADTTTGTLWHQDEGNASDSITVQITCGDFGGVGEDCTVATDTGTVSGSDPNNIPPLAWPGMIYQRGNTADADNQIDVTEGDLFIRADAGVWADESAVARAVITGGTEGHEVAAIHQEINTNTETGTNLITVDAGQSIDILVNAEAHINDESGHAAAFATIQNGAVEQWVRNSNSASNMITNDGVFGVLVQANAVGGSGADATAAANIFIGVDQYASADWAENLIDNGGTLSILANARADSIDSDFAMAYARIVDGIAQSASGASVAHNFIGNDEGAHITVGADAHAQGFSAYAAAYVGRGFNPFGFAGIEQYAEATDDDGSASVGINNSGSIDIHAVATALAVETAAFAHAYVDTGILQSAGGGLFSTENGQTAIATIVNSGDITIHSKAVAHAVGAASEGVLGFATAYMGTGIAQHAYVNGNDEGIVPNSAHVELNNSGLIDIGATADGTADQSGFAHAYVGAGLVQTARAQGAGTDEGDVGLAANADVLITNTNSIGVHVDAHADGSEFAWARANMGWGIYQSAYAGATGDANATADIHNTGGTINITAHALAHVGDATTTGAGTTETLNNNRAQAIASVFEGIYQSAYATGINATETAPFQHYSGNAVALATIDNAGTIHVGAAATATGGSAYADAYIDPAIHQFVGAVGGASANADANIVNGSGDSIDVLANGSANGGLHAGAFAGIAEGISQEVFAHALDPQGIANADASLNNSGSITIGAHAKAVALDNFIVGTDPTTQTTQLGDAFALARVTDGIVQLRNGGIFNQDDGRDNAQAEVADARATIVNSGSIDIFAQATGHGVDFAFAYAYIGDAIGQFPDATAPNDGNAGSTEPDAGALASFTNSGSVNIIASAHAVATGVLAPGATADNAYTEPQFGHAYAYAYVGTGLLQNAYASASHRVLDTVNATATVTEGVALAESKFINSGAFSVAAVARATAADATAIASIESGVYQSASASAGSEATAHVQLTNSASGSISVIGSAVAHGVTEALAIAHIDGISQEVNASAFDGDAKGTALIDNAGAIDIVARAQAIATNVVVTNTGTNLLDATETFVGVARAIAIIDHGIVQDVNVTASEEGTDVGNLTRNGAATGTASVVNSGSINILAQAIAGSADLPVAPMVAYAYAYISEGMEASASVYGETQAHALVSLNNTGSISVVAHALAIATDVIFADTAGITTEGGPGVFGTPAGWEYGVAYAQATLNANGGNAAIHHYATADAFHSNETADGGTTQTGQAFASAPIDNSGSITLAALATAVGGVAFADASLGTGIYEDASAYGGTEAHAHNGLANSGDILIAAVADAKGLTYAEGYAKITQTGVAQFASATTESGNSVNDGAFASNSLTNAGNLSVVASANATATRSAVVGGASTAEFVYGFAYAGAFIRTGIWQSATAEGVHTTTTEATTAEGAVTDFYHHLGNAHADNSLSNTGTL